MFIIFLLMMLVGRQEGHAACKTFCCNNLQKFSFMDPALAGVTVDKLA